MIKIFIQNILVSAIFEYKQGFRFRLRQAVFTCSIAYDSDASEKQPLQSLDTLIVSFTSRDIHTLKTGV